MNIIKHTLIIIMIIGIIPTTAFARGSFGSVDNSCADFCSAQQYEESLACIQGNYESSVDRIRYFGDSSIVVATCAYKNGDFEVAETLASMSFIKHPVATSFMRLGPKKGGAAHRQFLVELAQEARGVDASEAGEKGLEYARNSGQCKDADDDEEDDEGKTALDRCVDGYRYNVRSQVGEVTGDGGGALTDAQAVLNSFEFICGAHQEFSVENLTCTCATGYRKETKTSNVCILNIPRLYDAESVIDFETAVEGMALNTHATYILIDSKDVQRKVGVVKQITGVPLFTLDGKRYERDIMEILKPGLWTRTTRSLSSITTALNPLNWFHSVEKEEGKELGWQVAKETLADFESETKRLSQQYDLFQAELKKYKNYRGWAKFIISKYTETGKVVADVEKYATDLLTGTLKSFGESLPGAAFTKFVDEAKVETFADPAWFYIVQREAGATQKVVQSTDHVELDVFVGTYVRDAFGNGFYDRLEEVYQRWLLAKEFGRVE